MGFEQPKGGKNFFRVANGKFVGNFNGEDKSEVAYTGWLRAIKRFTDEYKGEEIQKIELALEDDEAQITLQFTLEAWFAVGFFQRIARVDLGEKFTIGVMGSDENEKISFCWMKQAGKKIEKDEEFPLPEKTTFKGKPFVDFSNVVGEADKIIAKLQKQLEKKGAAPASAPAADPAPTKGKAKVASNDDDLPF
jgi:hypothetical protein